MRAALYLTSPSVEMVAVPLDDLVSFAADIRYPDTTRVLTTRGTVLVLEDVETIVRLLTARTCAPPLHAASA